MKRRQKYIILLCCVLLCSLLITAVAVPVSASTTVYNEALNFNLEYPEDLSLLRLSSVAVGYDTAFHFTDVTDFELLPQASISDRESFNEFVFGFDWPGRESTVRTGVITYNVGTIYDAAEFPEYAFFRTLVINSGSLKIYSQDYDLKITAIRFSVRSIDPETYDVGKVIAYTSTVLVDFDFDQDTTYTFQYPRMMFDAGGLSPGANLAFCIDLIGESIEHKTQHSIGFYRPEGNSLFTFQYYDGPSPDIPQYVIPDDNVVIEETEFEELLNNQAQDLTTQFNDMGDAFWRNLNGLSLGMQRINTLLNDLRTDVPFLDFLIQASLYLGLVSFVLGCTNLISKITRK